MLELCVGFCFKMFLNFSDCKPLCCSFVCIVSHCKLCLNDGGLPAKLEFKTSSKTVQNIQPTFPTPKFQKSSKTVQKKCHCRRLISGTLPKHILEIFLDSSWTPTERFTRHSSRKRHAHFQSMFISELSRAYLGSGCGGGGGYYKTVCDVSVPDY